MGSGLIIGVLALFTIGSVLLFAVIHFGQFLRDPKNRSHASNIIKDGPSATATAERADPEGSVPLVARLDGSIASAHPAGPDKETSADRTERFHVQRRPA